MCSLISLLSEKSEWTNRFWSFCDIRDAMLLSVTSRAASDIPLLADTALMLIQRNSEIDIHVLDPENCTLGSVRLGMYRAIILDIRDPTFLFDRSPTVSIGPFSDDTDSSRSEEMYRIEKTLESYSYDQYDDFTPRHPDYKTHRRGGSFFNSDISDVAALAITTELSSIAKMALDQEHDDEQH